MVVESWITPEETPALAAEAATMIDARFGKLGEAQRAAFWASVRKAYNAPYNPASDTRRSEATAIVAGPIEIVLPMVDMPVAAMPPAAVAQELHAA